MPDIKFNAVEPAFCAPTSLPVAGREAVEKGAAVIMHMATIGKDGPTGTFRENEGEPGW
ncbi:MAG TPA: hypothetical protein VHU85_10375 [Acidimicrobiales bacterium]|jgi:hypothetical protein|nr:hypothetical protein [Acidimicrobiales bacterium]